MSLVTYLQDARQVRISLYYEGTSTIVEGMPVCYNFDTTDNWTAVDKATGLGTYDTSTAEGYQNEGKFIRVENPSSTNYMWFAGVVAKGSPGIGSVGPSVVDVFVPNGAVVPVYAYSNTTTGCTVLGLTDDGTYLKASTGDDDPMPCAVAMETTTRGSTAGLVLAKVFPTGQVLSSLGATFAPYRSAATGDAAGVRLYVDNLFTSSGATGPRTYGLYITGSRDTDYALTTAGCDDAGIRIAINNYAANESVFNFRGINVCAQNKEDGVVGELDNIISVRTTTDSDGVSTMIGCKFDAEHLGPGNPTEYGGIDIALCREGGAATTEYGLQLRTRGTINTAVNAAIRCSKDATDHGFINLFNIETDAVDVSALAADITWDSSDIKIPIVFNGTTYYLVGWAGS